jgi:uncharacterized protein
LQYLAVKRVCKDGELEMTKQGIIERISAELSVKTANVTSTVALLEEGNTVPFIARYRKEVTGSLDEVVIRSIEERLAYLCNLEDVRMQ